MLKCSRSLYAVIVAAFAAVSGCDLGTRPRAPETSAPDAAAQRFFEKVGSQGKYTFAWIDPAKADDVQEIKKAIAALDDPRERITIIGFWSDRSMVPKRLPMTDAQLDSQLGQYNRNSNTGLRRLVWSGKDLNL